MDQIAAGMFGQMGGQLGTADSMFGSFRPAVGPSPEEMEAGRERVMFKKHVQPLGYHVKIFDMHIAKQVKAYEKLMLELMLGMQTNTHKILVNEFELLNTPKGQQWHRYVEWAEFEYQVEATGPVGV